MRIATGRTDAKLAFVAVDSTDLKTRKTGLGSFTVYRSRNGGAATAYTTPTVSELSSANMPGVYVLTVDEDTTITSGVDEEEYVVHITATGMAPVTRAVELFRPKLTEGELVTASASAVAANVTSMAANVISATQIADNAITGAKIADNAIDAGAIADNAIDAGAIAANAITAAKIATDAITASQIAADAAAEIADAVWDVDATGHQTQGTFGQAVGDPVNDTNTIFKAVVTDAAGATVGADTTSIQADTDDIQTRLPAALVGGKMDASVSALGANAITASSIAADAIGASELASDAVTEIATAVADAVWDELRTDHVVSTSFGAMLQVIRTGTAAGGAAGTITLDGSASAVNDFYKNALIFILSGNGVGQSRTIAAYDGSTKVATVKPNWATNPNNTSVFLIVPRGSVVAVESDAITNASLQDSAISATKFVADAITASVVADGAIDAAALADNAITSAKIANNAITANKINDGALTTGKFDIGALTQAVISDGFAERIADTLWRRPLANIAASAYGAAIVERSPINALRKLVNRVKHTPGTPGTLDTYEEDDTTVAMSQDATTNSSSDPIVELDT